MDSGNVQQEELVSPEIMEAMGISRPAFEEVMGIIGRMPTVQELSTLLAMWDANGRQQSLYGWLKGQHHVVEKHEYLYTGTDTAHKEIREPRVKDCISLAHEVLENTKPLPLAEGQVPFGRSELLYMVGNVSTQFLDSEYARRCLHIVADPVKMETVDEDIAYLRLILGSLLSADVISSLWTVGGGGLFATLVQGCGGRVGFDILTCREIRLDAFLFGEEQGRFVVSLPEKQDDFFLLKMDEARINCCFLGHVTKGRLLVDDMDYGDIKGWKIRDKET
ncbi:MAG: AIR synthase-related protein [Bacteroidales bacterium]|nr:AIR synthase-related protein [Bacteroidales bacterium]